MNGQAGGGGRRRRTVALFLAAACMPALAGLFQLSAVHLARATQSAGSWQAWIGLAAGTPWAVVLLLTEAATFALWMLVLGELPLAVAFPLTAMGAVFSLALAAMWLGAAVPMGAWVGTVAILAGAWLIVA